jgi:hypothetical protein
MNLHFMVHTHIDRIYYVTEHDLSSAQAIIDFLKKKKKLCSWILI